jgi:hypothetical protein
MLVATLIYLLWIIAFIIYGAVVFRFQTKMILLGTSAVYTYIMWRFWKRLIAAAKEQDERN